MFHRTSGRVAGGRHRGWGVAAVVAAAALGVVGAWGRANGQGAKAEPLTATPALLRLNPEQDARPADRERFLATQRFELQTRPIVEAALVAHPEILQIPEVAAQKDPAGWIAGTLRVEAVAGTDFVQVGCKAANPTLAASVANAVTEAYIKDSGDRQNEAIDVQIKLLDQVRMEAEQVVHQMRKQMRSAGTELAASQLVAVEADDLREVRKDLRRVRLEKKGAEVLLARRKGDEGKALEDTVAVLGARETLLVKAEQEAAEALNRAESARLDFQAANDDLAQVRERARSVQESLQGLKIAIRGRRVAEYSPAKPIPE